MMAMLSTKGIETVATSGTSTPQQTSSTDAVASNDDLLTHILLRLPIRSLIKFKSVSKHWLSLISNPHFSRRRNPYSNPISGLFLSKSYSPDGPNYEFLPLDTKRSTSFPNLPAWIRVLQSCNGLLCCYSNQNDEAKRNYYIYNPTTHQFTILPVLCDVFSLAVASVLLAFDPYKSRHYEVVCVRRIGNSLNRYWIEIYSSKTGTWRVSGDAFSVPYNVKFDAGVFWNGAVHWIGNMVRTMVSFNVDEEQLRETPMPEIHRRSPRRLQYFGESRGHLHLVVLEGHLIVYEMEEDYSRWFVRYQVDVDAIVAAFPEMRGRYLHPSTWLLYSVSILCLVREENDDESFLVLHLRDRALCYSFKEETFKKICDVSLKYSSSGWQCAHPYIESLAGV